MVKVSNLRLILKKNELRGDLLGLYEGHSSSVILTSSNPS